MAWMDYGYVAREVVATGIVLVIVATILWAFVKALLGNEFK